MLPSLNKVFIIIIIIIIIVIIIIILVQYIAILRKVKNPALRYFYLNAEKNTSLGTAGYVRSPQIC